jgi:hypothetical protein
MSIGTGGRGRLRVGVVLIVCVVAAARQSAPAEPPRAKE